MLSADTADTATDKCNVDILPSSAKQPENPTEAEFAVFPLLPHPHPTWESRPLKPKF